MYKLANGWTKQKVLEQVKKYNNGYRSVDYDVCVYLSPDGNRCAIGAFIPDNHKALKLDAGAKKLIDTYPDLIPLLPFTDLQALVRFQDAHDTAQGLEVHNDIQCFLEDECEE